MLLRRAGDWCRCGSDVLKELEHSFKAVVDVVESSNPAQRRPGSTQGAGPQLSQTPLLSAPPPQGGKRGKAGKGGKGGKGFKGSAGFQPASVTAG